MKVAQALADAADVDLILSSGRRAEGDDCSVSLHNCGKAIDIKAINGVDLGQGRNFNLDALGLVSRVQAAAMGISQIRENFGPVGLLKSDAPGRPQRMIGYDSASFRDLWLTHRNHIHIGIH